MARRSQNNVNFGLFNPTDIIEIMQRYRERKQKAEASHFTTLMNIANMKARILQAQQQVAIRKQQEQHQIWQDQITIDRINREAQDRARKEVILRTDLEWEKSLYLSDPNNPKWPDGFEGWDPQAQLDSIKSWNTHKQLLGQQSFDVPSLDNAPAFMPPGIFNSVANIHGKLKEAKSNDPFLSKSAAVDWGTKAVQNDLQNPLNILGKTLSGQSLTDQEKAIETSLGGIQEIRKMFGVDNEVYKPYVLPNLRWAANQLIPFGGIIIPQSIVDSLPEKEKKSGWVFNP